MIDIPAELAFLNQLLGYNLEALHEAMHSIAVAEETIQTASTVINRVLGELTGIPVIVLPCEEGDYT